MFEPLALAKRPNATLESLGPPGPGEEAQVVFALFDQYFAEERGNIFRALLRLITIPSMFLAFLLTLLQAAFTIAVPFFTKLILEHLSGQTTFSNGELAGLCLATIFFPFFGAVCQAHMLLVTRRASLKMFIALTQAVFNKSFRKRDLSIGRSISLIANDAGVAMERSIQLFFPLLVAPVQLGVLLWLLYRELGVAVFAGIGAVVLFVPISTCVFVTINKRYRHIMQFSDKRQKLVNEFLGAIRIVKAYAWEDALLKKIGVVREQELHSIKLHALALNIGMGLVLVQLASVLQIVVIWTYYATGGVFSSPIIFPALQLFGLIQAPLSALPNSVSQAVMTRTALRRIETFLNEPDFDDGTSTAAAGANDKMRRLLPRETNEEGEVLIEFSEDAGFAWREAAEEKRERFELKKINCELRAGQLVAVVSRIGGGKSSFIKAILGEMDHVSGRFAQRGTVSYASQSAFILNATLKDNILFGTEFDEDRYLQVLEVCDLLSDLERFVGGDKIILGEKGVNLSGGQQARLSLARAIYARSDIVLADDSLAAVDAHVGNKLFDTVRACSLLKNRLMILVTNQLFRLKRVDRIVSFSDNGDFLGCMTFDEFRKLEPSIEVQLLNEEEEEARAQELEAKAMAKEELHGLKAQNSIKLARAATERFKNEEPEKLFTDEFQKRGGVEAETFASYMRSAGLATMFFAVAFTVMMMVLPAMGQIIMSQLTNAQQASCPYNATIATTNCNDEGTAVYLGWYTFTLVLALIMCATSGLGMALVRVHSARTKQAYLLNAVSGCTVDFFDKTPAGRISNRFSKDCASVDNQLSLIFMWVTLTASGVLSSIIAVAVGTNGVYLAILVPILACFVALFRFQRRGGAVLHRMEGVARAPIYSLFSEVLNGRSTIRAFSKQDMFIAKNKGFLRANSVPFFLGRNALPAFLTMYLNIIGLLSSLAVTFFVVFSGAISPGMAGLALTSVSQVVGVLYICIFILQDFELQLNAVERIDTFVRTEALLDQEHAVAVGREEVVPARAWPEHGQISVQNLAVGYREGVDVISDLCLEIAPTEKIGICGRTGSAKSTLLKCFLRIMEARRGSILMDGVDIAQVQLKTLRQRVGLIPQEPTLFYETVRYNLDPFDEHSDEEIYSALALCGLDEFIRKMGLEYMVSEQGANFSQGQRQLLCVVRALLRKSKILLLDEASASTDEESDRVLQSMIRVAFKQTTTLTVAHRLVSIADSDRVLVLSNGRVEEFDSPANLLSKSDGMFRGMVDVLEEEERELCYKMAGAAAAAVTETTPEEEGQQEAPGI